MREKFVDLRVGKALGLSTLVALICALGGMLVGGLCGALIPEYYRGVFSKDIGSPVQLGLGLGLAQGLLAGVGLSAALVLAVGIAQGLAGRRRPTLVAEEGGYPRQPLP